ncbi:ABC transporter substrate-binding protein [Erythrobacter sanguineus]|uniref:Extracellular solute-binding protein, family 5 Middle n=1 Tax=Erythrobacter sanguineus TaxID=198312 RepID=A0A1M7T0Q0_9SPHN|nr:ABC transporter substrate-binding protein [Erythrobacter sanguineus]SHN64316.1 extracellular solute-binding protein, family 5 Middle [Erythrobacter sanguineus]
MLALGSCGPSNGSGPVEVAIIGTPESLFQQGVRLSPSAQHLRATTFEGLVALDQGGQIVPAIAERWIITDDGLSYIFRLREGTWPDGEEITAADVRRLLRDDIRRLRGTSLGLDLAKVEEIRAMTGRVIEIRLSGPMPDFLRLLAQPELGFVKSGGGSGPMVLSRDEDTMLARLSALPPEARGLPVREDWEALARPLEVRALAAQEAVAAFSRGDIDLVLGGSLIDFPLAEAGPLSRGTIQVDPALGLLGLVIRQEKGLLADPVRREALSMAIDRAALIQPFGLGGWQASTWIVPPGQFAGAAVPSQRWQDLSQDDRRAIAAGRMREWVAQSGEEARVRVGLPVGPGSDLLYRQLTRAWAAIGVNVERVAPGDGAEIELRDNVARYSSPRWYLNQFHCSLKAGLCSPEADALVRQSLDERDLATREKLLAEAHAALVAREAYIPLGAPVRWSLVRGSIANYRANQWGLHPLFPLSQPTT